MYSTALSTVFDTTRLASAPGYLKGKRTGHTAVDGVGILIRDLDAELLLNGHHDLHGVQAVEAEVVGEVCCGGDLGRVLDLFSTEQLATNLHRPQNPSFPTEAIRMPVPDIQSIPSIPHPGYQAELTLSNPCKRALIRSSTSGFDNPAAAAYPRDHITRGTATVILGAGATRADLATAGRTAATERRTAVRNILSGVMWGGVGGRNMEFAVVDGRLLVLTTGRLFV
jgi:hypothetical protein